MVFNVVGFLVGALCAIVFYVVAGALLDFEHEDLILGVIAVLIWVLLTFNWPRRGIGVR